MTIATRTSSARTRCSVSGARRRSRPPPKSSSVAHPAAMSTASSGTSGHHFALYPLVRVAMALAHRVRVAGVDEVDDQQVALLVDVDRHLVRRLAGEHAPQRDGVGRTVPAGDLHEAGLAVAAKTEASGPPAATNHLDR